MYSVWTGPRPGGGAYCNGNAGGFSTTVRSQPTAATPASTVNTASHITPVTDCPSTRSHGYDHGRAARGGVGTSTPARTVTGVRGGSDWALTRTRLPSTVSSSQALPTP